MPLRRIGKNVPKEICCPKGPRLACRRPPGSRSPRRCSRAAVTLIARASVCQHHAHTNPSAASKHKTSDHQGGSPASLLRNKAGPPWRGPTPPEFRPVVGLWRACALLSEEWPALHRSGIYDFGCSSLVTFLRFVRSGRDVPTINRTRSRRAPPSQKPAGESPRLFRRICRYG